MRLTVEPILSHDLPTILLLRPRLLQISPAHPLMTEIPRFTMPNPRNEQLGSLIHELRRRFLVVWRECEEFH